MFKPLSLDQFLELVKKSQGNKFSKRAIFSQEIMADRLTPISLFESFSSKLKGGSILESGLQQEHTGRYSFLAFDPMAHLELRNKTLTQRIGEKTDTYNTDPFVQLRHLINELDCACPAELNESITQTMGLISYDAIRLFENIPDRHTRDEAFPEILFNFYRTTLTFDHQRQTVLISQVIDLGKDPKQAYFQAQEIINNLIKRISASSETSSTPASHSNSISIDESDINDTYYINLVERAKDYIKRGDAFQIVLSRCFKKSYKAKPFDIYRALRQVSPAPYMFFIPLEDRVIIGASPERMITVHKNKISINPIAGTRKRIDKNHDQEIEDELLNDTKELAEHRMLVDLARNDLGRICEAGSIQIEELLQVKHYSHISHLTSVISGTLPNQCDALDALAATFPAGTLSGAPKIRAMQIIDELESSRRGLYGGAIGRLDYAKNFDSCIAIRIAILKDGVATIRTGAGIVHDSIPTAEAEETRQKASALLAAIRFSEGEH